MLIPGAALLLLVPLVAGVPKLPPKYQKPPPKNVKMTPEPQIRKEEVCLMGDSVDFKLHCAYPKRIALCQMELGASVTTCRFRHGSCCYADGGGDCKLQDFLPTLYSCIGQSTCSHALHKSAVGPVQQGACQGIVGKRALLPLWFDYLVVRYACVHPGRQMDGCISTPPVSSPPTSPVTVTALASNSTAGPQRMGEGEEFNVGAVVGISIAAVAALICLILLIICVSRKHALVQRRFTSFKSTVALAQFLARQNQTPSASQANICTVGDKDNDPQYHDLDRSPYSEVNDPAFISNMLYDEQHRSGGGTGYQHVDDTSSPATTPRAANQLGGAKALGKPSAASLNLVPNIDAKDVGYQKAVLSQKGSATSEEDNSAVLSPESPRPRVRPHPPLRRNAKFNYNPPEVHGKPRLPMNKLEEEDEEETPERSLRVPGYEEVWRAHGQQKLEVKPTQQKPKLARGGQPRPYEQVWTAGSRSAAAAQVLDAGDVSLELREEGYVGDT